MAAGDDATGGERDPVQKQRCAAAWSDLSPDILCHISTYLSSIWDMVKFRGVCSSWRSVADFPSQAPSLLLPYDLDTTARSFLDSSDYSVHTIHMPEARGKWLLGTPYCWLVLLGEQEEDEDGGTFTVSLLNPITRAHIFFPPLPNKITTLPEQRGGSSTTSATKSSLTANPASSNVLLALLIFTNLVVCRLDGETWTVIDLCVPPRFMVDFTYFDGAFYIVDYSTGITVVNAISLKRKYSAPSSRRLLKYSNQLHLVESAGDLLLLETSRGSQILIQTFKLDRSNNKASKWVKAHESIGDRALFVSNNHSSISLSCHDSVGFGGDLIYFAADADVNHSESGYRDDRVVVGHYLWISEIVDGESIGHKQYYCLGSRKLQTANGNNLIGLTWIIPSLC